MLGEGPKQALKASFLNRTIKLVPKQGYVYAPNPRHIDEVVEELDLKEVKPVAAPGVRDGGPAVRESADSLGPDEAAMFARCTGKLVYFSADRLESAFVVRLLAQDLKTPTRLSLMRLKHLAKFLKGTRSWCWCYKFQEE